MAYQTGRIAVGQASPVSRASSAITRSSLLEGSDVSLRILTLFILTTIMTLVAGFAAPHAGTSQAAGCTPTSLLRTLNLVVPANRPATFPLSEVVTSPDSTASTWQAVLGLTHDDGSLRLSSANESAAGSATVTSSGLTFAPKPGFVGTSSGWVLAIYPDDTTPAHTPASCSSKVAGSPLDAVVVTFEVRNTLPVAVDDAVTVPDIVRTVDVGPDSGVLANDLDWNGDPLVVHAAGVTTFPWGSVQLAADGSYRIVVTDHDLLAPATVRYVVWDQQGSPNSVDTGYLEIDFSGE